VRVTLEQGLSEDEITGIEADYGFRFPPDLRDVLTSAQPTSDGFTDWRNTHSAGLRGLLAEPIEGVLDAVHTRTFWFPQWGARPGELVTAREIARQGLRTAPTLIPFWGGIYIADDPMEEGNPLFYVYGEDIVFAAETLYALIRRSRSGGSLSEAPGPFRYISFWSDYAAQ